MMMEKLSKVTYIGLVLIGLLVGACTPTPSPTPTEAPTATAEPAMPTEPPATVTVEPTVTQEPTAVPDAEAIAYYATGAGATGAEEDLTLFALSAEGESEALDPRVPQGATVSASGRWVAMPTSAPPANEVTILDLTTSSTHEVSTSPGHTIFGLAFDAAESRLAVLEVSQIGPEDQEWAILSVELADGTYERFVGGDWMAGGAMLPGFPLGWTASGQELLLDTFLPYTDAGSQGVVAIEMPPGAVGSPIEELNPRELVPAAAYRTQPRLSRDATRLLYLGRNPGYAPEGYEPIAFDFAVNQLWSLDVRAEGSTPELWLSIEDGSALAGTAAWSPDGQQALYAQGTYAGDTFESLTLKIHDGSAVVQEIGEVLMAGDAYLTDLYWCRPETALVKTMSAEGDQRLTLVNLADERTIPVAHEPMVSILGCVDDSTAVAQ